MPLRASRRGLSLKSFSRLKICVLRVIQYIISQPQYILLVTFCFIGLRFLYTYMFYVVYNGNIRENDKVVYKNFPFTMHYHSR